MSQDEDSYKYDSEDHYAYNFDNDDMEDGTEAGMCSSARTSSVVGASAQWLYELSII